MGLMAPSGTMKRVYITDREIVILTLQDEIRRVSAQAGGKEGSRKRSFESFFGLNVQV